MVGVVSYHAVPFLYNSLSTLRIAGACIVDCEKMRDLLNPSSDNMKLREYSLPTKASEKASCTGFVVQDITEVVCKDSNDIYNVIDTGKSHRATAPTLMNAESSRSHSILLIKVNQKPSESVVNAAEDAVPNTKRAARLYLVDLAGSEKVGKTGATGERLKEAQNINKSLTSFGMVINALSEGLSHVPYRDSKLTMILMDSIGGNSKTTLIICASPEAAQLSETLSTLRFGERAKKITNTVKVNEELGISEYKALCQAAKLEIAQLKKKLAAAEELNLASTDESSFDTVSKEPGSGPGSPEKSASAKRQAAEAAIAMQDALRQQVEDLQYMCLDLESQLEAEKNENIALRMEANANKAEMHLLKCLTDELQSKLFQATTTLQAPLAVPSPTVDVDEGNREPDREPFVTPDQSPHSAAANGSSAPASPVASVTAEDLAEISEQHAVLTQHIMDETESMKAMTATNAAQSAELAQYIEKYYTLNKDSNEQIDRIMAKLNSEQTIRVNAECQYAELLDKYNVLEEQLEAAQRAVTAANDVGAATTESSSGSSFGSFFSSPAKAVAQSISPVTSPVSRRSSWTNLMSGAAAKMFSDSSAPSYQRSAQSSQALQAIIQAQSKQLQALTQANAKLQTSESQLQYEQECTKEQYETLLIMKDNILKTILGENKDLADQKEAFMAEQHEHLATIEQLTYLLRTSMQRKATETQMKMTASPSLVSCRSELSEMDEETFLDMDGDGVDGYDGDRIEEEEGDGVEYGDYVDNDGDDNATLDEETEMPMPAVEEEDEGEQEEFEEPVRVHDDASSTEGLDT